MKYILYWKQWDFKWVSNLSPGNALRNYLGTQWAKGSNNKANISLRNEGYPFLIWSYRDTRVGEFSTITKRQTLTSLLIVILEQTLLTRILKIFYYELSLFMAFIKNLDR